MTRFLVSMMFVFVAANGVAAQDAVAPSAVVEEVAEASENATANSVLQDNESSPSDIPVTASQDNATQDTPQAAAIIQPEPNNGVNQGMIVQNQGTVGDCGCNSGHVVNYGVNYQGGNCCHNHCQNQCHNHCHNNCHNNCGTWVAPVQYNNCCPRPRPRLLGRFRCR